MTTSREIKRLQRLREDFELKIFDETLRACPDEGYIKRAEDRIREITEQIRFLQEVEV